MKNKQKQDIEREIPDEIYVYLDHDSHTLWYPDYEEVSWLRIHKNEESDSVEHHLEYFRTRPRKIKQIIPKLSVDIWQGFLKQIDEIGVFSWESGDTTAMENITDISSEIWKIRIVSHGGSNFEISGLVSELPSRFDEFCKAISKLIGRPFGIK